jgi:hypothetical protein
VKKPVILACLLAALVFGGPPAYELGRAWKGAREARQRVEWMLRSRVSDNEQTSICQFERGMITIPMADLEAALPGYESFWREAGFGDGRGWVVTESVLLEEGRAEIRVAKDGDVVVLLVEEGEPLVILALE